jgi:acylphosphatase
VTGWVLNLPDGRVEAVFEGEKENVEKLVAFCKKGPAGAKVTAVEVVMEKYRGEFKDFQLVW